MFEIDIKRVQGDTGNMLLSNISEQLSEIIVLLKPRTEPVKEPENESVTEPVAAKKLYTCKKCGRTSDSKAILTRRKGWRYIQDFVRGNNYVSID